MIEKTFMLQMRSESERMEYASKVELPVACRVMKQRLIVDIAHGFGHFYSTCDSKLVSGYATPLAMSWFAFLLPPNVPTNPSRVHGRLSSLDCSRILLSLVPTSFFVLFPFPSLGFFQVFGIGLVSNRCFCFQNLLLFLESIPQVLLDGGKWIGGKCRVFQN